jgi:hypothetical protein
MSDIIAMSIVNANGCWLWQGRLSPQGYAVYGKADKVRVARFAWELEHRQEMRDGMYACHTCDVSNCVNPAHVYEGTPGENLKDAYVRGQRIAKRHTQTLSNEDVRAIRTIVLRS